MSADTHLRRAVRALAGLDGKALDAVTPDAMRAVMTARGWEHEADVAWAVDPSVTDCARYRCDGHARGEAAARGSPGYRCSDDRSGRLLRRPARGRVEA